jgi:hypothetical protein
LPVVQSSTTKQVSVANLTVGRTVTAAGFTASSNGNTEVIISATSATPILSLLGLSSSNPLIGYLGSGGLRIGTVTGTGAAGFTQQLNLDGTTGNFTLNSGNFIPAVAAKGVNFTANTPAAGMTSQLLNWYEEGVWTTGMTADGGTVTLSFDKLNYTRAGRIVSVSGEIVVSAISSPTGDIYISLPFTNSASTSGRSGVWSSYLGVAYTFTGVPLGPMVGLMTGGATKMTIRVGNNAGGTVASGFLIAGTTFDFGFTYQCQ